MIDKKELERLYVFEKKTGKEIATIAGVKSCQTIYNWLDKCGIKRRDNREAQKPVTPSEDILYGLYINKEYSIDFIGSMLCSSESSISNLLDEYGIEKRKNWRKMAGWNKGKSISKEQKEKLSDIAKGRVGVKSPRYGARLSKGTKQKISNSLKGRFRGSANPNWCGGQRYDRLKWFSRYEYKDWRKSIYSRDDYTCQMCGKQSEGDIEAHHILPWAKFPNKRFDVGNGITLCKKCHRFIKGKEAEYSNFFFGVIHQSTP